MEVICHFSFRFAFFNSQLILMTILLVFFYFLIPVLILYLTKKVSFFQKIGAVVLAYIIGLIFGNIGIRPSVSERFKGMLGHASHLSAEEAEQLLRQGVIGQSDMLYNQTATVQENIMSVAILLAIPLLLFSLDIKKWLKLAKAALLSLVLAMVSLLAIICIGHYIFKDLIYDSWKISGMLVGLYTGGTPNLAVISAALGVDSNTFLLTNTYDMAVGAICLVFLMTGAQWIFGLFLPKFDSKHSQLTNEMEDDPQLYFDHFQNVRSKNGMLDILKGFLLSAVIVAVGGGLSLLVAKDTQMLTAILSITTLGILTGSLKRVNKIQNTFQLGMYFIIVFSLVIASMGNLESIFHIESLHLFGYVVLVVLGAMVIHVFLSYLFKVDADTTIITITALTYSPPFVPVLAGALKNKQIIISGLTGGILGYAFGNYLGIAVAYFLK